METAIPPPSVDADAADAADADDAAEHVAARPNRYGRRRALVLGLVYVLMAAHIAHWKVTGKTLAPLELNEVMVTLELGVVTAGFLFMAVAVLASMVFGRFFCSWGCHILALEDLCAWLLAKVGVRPKPVRSRTLLIVPPIAMLYMFAWPQVERLLAGRALPELTVQGDQAGWASFVTNDFWRNLPPVGVALFTFAVCGFLIVYVMGSRSFCRYACPYGAIFALADKVAPGRIVARDGCTGCGTCTATCQSDIPVHKELAAFGTVTSASCLKDLDCISVCPSGAIAYGFTRPTLFRSRAVEGAPKRRYDFTLAEDLGLAGLFLAALLVLRGLYGVVPFLLSLALAALVSYGGVISLRLLRRESVKLGRAQLKLARRLTGSGWAFAGLAAVSGLLLVHSAAVRVELWRGQRAFDAGSAGGDASNAGEALLHLEHVERWGLLRTPGVDGQLATLHLALGAPARAERYLRRVVERNPDDAHARLRLARALSADGRGEAARTEVDALLAAPPPDDFPEHAAELRGEALALRGALCAAAGDTPGAIDAYRAALRERPDAAGPHRALAELLSGGGRFEAAVTHLEAAVASEPGSAATWYNLAVLRAQVGREREAIAAYHEASRLAPDDADTWNNLGFLLVRAGARADAERCFRRAIELAPRSGHPRYNLGRLLADLGRDAEAAPELERAAALDPRYAEPMDGRR